MSVAAVARTGAPLSTPSPSPLRKAANEYVSGGLGVPVTLESVSALTVSMAFVTVNLPSTKVIA